MTYAPLTKFTKNIALLVRSKKLDEARKLMLENKNNLKLDAQAYSVILKGYVDSNNEVKANDWLNTIKKLNVKPSVFIYTSLINLSANSGNIEKAKTWFDEMTSLDIKPTIITYNVLMKAYGEARDLTSMRRIFDDLEIRPNATTYSILIKYYGLNNDLKSAIDVYNLIGNTSKQNDYTVSEMIMAYINCNEPKAGLEFYDSLKDVEGKFIVILELLLKGGRYQQCIDFFTLKFVKQGKRAITNDALDLVIQACRGLGNKQMEIKYLDMKDYSDVKI